MSETVHASAVIVCGRGVLIRGPSGAGKSTLAALLVARGGWLVADDRVFLSARAGRLLASAPAPITGLLELRGRGIVPVPHERAAVVSLVVDLVSPDALERMPEAGEATAEILGVRLPRQAVAGASSSSLLLIAAALRADASLGLSIGPCARIRSVQDDRPSRPPTGPA